MPGKNRAFNLLFIGNSFTQRNNLPGLIEKLAAEGNVRVKWKLISVGGASLRTHWNPGRAAKEIASGDYDYVVLQEQSTLPVKNAGRMAENVRLFDEVIKKVGSKTALYMTWARRSTPDAQKAITDAYTAIGKELGATVIPVGLTWKRFLEKHETPVLHDRDGSHPTPAGSYLAACVFLVTLFKINPIGFEFRPAELATADVAELQRAAWKQFGNKN